MLRTQNVEVILNQLKMLKPKIMIKKNKQKNTPNKRNNYERRKKISLISFEISVIIIIHIIIKTTMKLIIIGQI